MKPFWKSKTVLVNVVGAVVLSFLGHEAVSANGDIVAIVAAAVNIILRVVTTEGLSVK
jgi:hypothetical protein